jgi:hypothetical protein
VERTDKQQLSETCRSPKLGHFSALRLSAGIQGLVSVTPLPSVGNWNSRARPQSPLRLLKTLGPVQQCLTNRVGEARTEGIFVARLRPA